MKQFDKHYDRKDQSPRFSGNSNERQDRPNFDRGDRTDRPFRNDRNGFSPRPRRDEGGNTDFASFQKPRLDTTPQVKEFMAHQDLFEKLKDQFDEIAVLIRTAAIQRRRIFIKHHNDCDGFCAGLALEKALIPLIEKVNTKSQAAWEKLKRMPSFSPYYHIEDVVKDIAQFKSLEAKFDEKPPLILLVDLGSGPENVLPIRMVQTAGCEVVIIDHHPIDPTVDSLVQYHLNPLKVERKEDSSLSAGILCAELARLINAEIDTKLNAAVSCIGDRVEPVYADAYFAQVADKFDQPMLLRIAKALDFTVYNLRSIEGRELLAVFMGENEIELRQYVDLLAGEIESREQKIISQALSIVKLEQTEHIHYGLLNVDEMIVKDNYPKLGQIVGMVSDALINQKHFDKPFVMMGLTPNSITFRAQHESHFDFQKLLPIVQQKVPFAFVEGGGHPCAGTFRCAESRFSEVYNAVLDYLRTL